MSQLLLTQSVRNELEQELSMDAVVEEVHSKLVLFTQKLTVDFSQ